MRERLQGLTRVFAGCAVLALVSCGAGADRTGATAEAADAVASSQDSIKKSSGPTVTPQTSGTPNGLIAISAVNARVAWAVGRFGTYVITTDGGKTWRSAVVPGAETLQFRDVEAVSDKVAYLLSLPTDTIAPRIYKTLDGGKTWKIEFEAPDTSYFYDCFAFWDPWSGITLGDSLNGQLPVIRTFDGKTWHNIGDRLPPALPGEAGFASSGTCAATQGHRRAWLTTGGTGITRVFYTSDRGQTWGVTTAPITAGVDQAGGGFSIAFRDARHGILGGGDLAATVVVNNIARSSDGGRTWVAGTNAPIPGAIYGLSYAGHGRGGHDDDDGEHDRGHGHDGSGSIRVVATSPLGTAWSPDEGRSWTTIAGLAGLWAVTFGSEQTGWLVGTNGQIVRIDF
jgi:photosystem II stability/assembly factor-like uncharacterized protein